MISTFFKTLGNHSACKKPCIPVLYKNYGELYNTDSNGTLIPVCKIGSDNKCMATNGFLANLKIGSRQRWDCWGQIANCSYPAPSKTR